jgi:hypothetical protein
MNGGPGAPSWWSELSVAALLGTDRRPAGLGSLRLPGALAGAVAQLDGDPAAVLMDAAALAVAYRRAGVLPERVEAVPAPAPAEELAQPSRRAAALLAGVLGTNVELVRFWCETAAAGGRVAPPAHLPALLDLAVRQVSIRPAVVAVLGERGRWLAAMQPTWEKAVEAGERERSARRAARSGPPSAAAAQLLDRRQRRSLLASLRATDVHLVAQQLTALPSPWSPEVAADVLTWLQARLPELPQLASRGLLSLIAQCFPVHDRSIAELAATQPDEGWRVRLAFVARDIATRHDIHEALR